MFQTCRMEYINRLLKEHSDSIKYILGLDHIPCSQPSASYTTYTTPFYLAILPSLLNSMSVLYPSILLSSIILQTSLYHPSVFNSWLSFCHLVQNKEAKVGSPQISFSKTQAVAVNMAIHRSECGIIFYWIQTAEFRNLLKDWAGLFRNALLISVWQRN